MDMILVWEVVVDSREPEWFDDLDVAVAYLRVEFKCGAKTGSFESKRVSQEEYDLIP